MGFMYGTGSFFAIYARLLGRGIRAATRKPSNDSKSRCTGHQEESVMSTTSSNERIFEEIIKFVLEHEGGFVDDPEDPGGATNFGISSVHNPDVNVEDLTKPQAIQIYKDRYWHEYQLDQLAPAWAMVMMDTVVNIGGERAVRMLQETVGTTVDGIIGPQTLAAANNQRNHYSIGMFCARRIQYYSGLRHWERFGMGWTRRTLDNYAMAATQL